MPTKKTPPFGPLGFLSLCTVIRVQPCRDVLLMANRLGHQNLVLPVSGLPGGFSRPPASAQAASLEGGFSLRPR